MPKASKIDQVSSEAQNATSLLNPQEYQLCKQLAAGGEPWSQRAKALLAINEGASETVASERSQLRATQVKYWLNKFKTDGIGMFPEHLLKEAESIPTTAAENTLGDDLPTLDETGNPKKLKKTKQARDRKGKGKKKKSKVGKGRRSKKKEKAGSAGSKPKKQKNKK